MRFSDFKALSFDCYGTLIDWERGMLAALDAWLRRHRARPDPEAILQAFGEAESRAEAAHPDLPYPEILGRVHARLGQRFGLPTTAEDQRAFGASVRDWPAFSDSEKALRALSKRFKLFILSNIDRASFAKSNRKLGVKFDAVYTAADIGSYKPDERNFRFLIGHLQEEHDIRQHEILHVAQSLYHDHVPAKKLGLATCWIDRRHGKAGGATPEASSPVSPDFTFNSLQGLVEAIEADDAKTPSPTG